MIINKKVKCSSKSATVEINPFVNTYLNAKVTWFAMPVLRDRGIFDSPCSKGYDKVPFLCNAYDLRILII